jgi:gluconate kinase
MEDSDLEAVLLIGVYGSGKTSVAEEMAEALEAVGARYAAIDLDWLAWANIDDGHGEAGNRLMLANLVPMLANFRAAGMRRFILAGSYATRSELDDLRDALEMPLRVVRLEVPLDVVERRLAPNPTSGRQHDLEVARAQIAAHEGEGLEDLAVDGDRPTRVVADEIIGWLGWA